MPDLKLGKLPGRIPVGLRDLTYYAAGPLPQAPAEVSVPSVSPDADGTPWGIDGNSDYGDCGVAGLKHGLQAAASDTSENESFPTADQVVSYYLNYTGGQDSGVVLSDFLAHVQQNQFYGHTVSAYAPVSVSDVNTLLYAINAYDFAYVGVTVTQAMMNAAQGEPPWTWTLEEAQGDSIGGHCIPVVGYDSSFLYAVTWGQVVRIAYPAWHQMGDEAWCLLTGELTSAQGDGHGLNLDALKADLNRLNS